MRLANNSTVLHFRFEASCYDGHGRLRKRCPTSQAEIYGVVECLPILRCLHSHSCLRLADADECRLLNAAIDDRNLFDHLGRCVSRRLDGALINKQVTFAYPIYGGIPHLLVNESIPLDVVAGKFKRGAM